MHCKPMIIHVVVTVYVINFFLISHGGPTVKVFIISSHFQQLGVDGKRSFLCKRQWSANHLKIKLTRQNVVVCETKSSLPTLIFQIRGE